MRVVTPGFVTTYLQRQPPPRKSRQPNGRRPPPRLIPLPPSRPPTADSPPRCRYPTHDRQPSADGQAPRLIPLPPGRLPTANSPPPKAINAPFSQGEIPKIKPPAPTKKVSLVSHIAHFRETPYIYFYLSSFLFF